MTSRLKIHILQISFQVNFTGLLARIITRKHDPSGTLLWEQLYADSRRRYLRGSVLGYDDKIYQNISLNGSSWIPGEVVFYRDTLIIHKYDKSGEFSVLIHDPMDEEGVQSVSRPYCFDTDSTGNIYVLVNRYRASANYDELVLRKYDNNGNRLWVKLISEIRSFAGNTFWVNKEGDVFISYISSAATNERYVSKYDCNGEQIWQNHMLTYCDRSINLTVSDTGQILLLSDYCLECFSESGELLWSGDSHEYMKSLDFDRSGNILLSSLQDGSVFITKLAMTDGSEIWKQEYIVSSDNPGIYYPLVKTDYENDVYVLSGTNCSDYGNCGLLVKYESSGSLKYESRFNQSYTISDRLNCIVRNKKGDIYIFEFSKSNLWILHYSADGSLIQTKSLGQMSLVYYSKPKFDNQGYMYFQVRQENKIGIVKLNTNLDILWSTLFIMVESGYNGRICFDVNSTGEIVIGYVSSSWDDSDLQTNILHVYQCNNSGQLEWQKSYGINSPRLRNIQIDRYSNVYCAVYSGRRSELIKFNKDGSDIWRNAFEAQIVDFIIDNWGNPVVKLFDYKEGFNFAKYSPAGNLLWQYFFDFTDEEYYYYFQDPGMICDAYGRLIVSLHYYGYSEVAGHRLLVLNRQGELQWSSKDEGFYLSDNIHCDVAGNIYLTGYIIAQSQVQPGVQKFNFDGELCWSTSVMINESFNYLNPQSVVTESGDIFLAAEISGLQWGLLKLAKLTQTGEDIPDLSIPQLQIRQNFPNPFNNQTTIIYRIPDLSIFQGSDPPIFVPYGKR